MSNTLIPADAGLAEMLIDSSIDGIISINRDWIITAWNKAAATVTGRQGQKALGRKLTDVLPAIADDAETLRAIEHAFDGYKGFVPARDSFGHRKHLENYFIPLRDDATGVIGVMAIMHDVAHRIKAEMQLQALNVELEKRYRQLQSTASELANFTWISSNNIKNPIRTIYTAIEYLIKTESRQLSNNAKAAFRRMQSSLNKMNLLLDDMLGLSQISILDRPTELINLEEVASAALADLNARIREKNGQVNVEELCVVKGHRDQLKLLMYHLVDNAIKFNEDVKPQVTITCVSVNKDRSNDNGDNGKAYNCVTVTDNGIGIEKSSVDRIFNMFEKIHRDTTYRGSGMGLAIAKKIMHAHDGYIEVESTPGQGSTFKCFFPPSENQ